MNVDDPIEEERERLQEAAANSTEELKDAVGELAAAAQTQANGVIETGRWIWLGAGFIAGLFVGFRAERKDVFERSSDE